MLLAYLTDIETILTPGCSEDFPLYLDDPCLNDCNYSTTGIKLPGVLGEGVVLTQAIRENATLVIVMDDDTSGKAAFVIMVAGDALKRSPYLHLCPVCGYSGPFDAFCPTQYELHSNGEFMPLKNARASFGDDVRTGCPSCEYKDDRKAFQVSQWRHYEMPDTNGPEETS